MQLFPRTVIVMGFVGRKLEAINVRINHHRARMTLTREKGHCKPVNEMKALWISQCDGYTTLCIFISVIN